MKTEIGVVRYVTDRPKELSEFGEIEIEIQCSAEADIYRLSIRELRKFLVREDEQIRSTH